MKLKRKTIEFACEGEIIDLPKPAKLFIPDWYKDGPKPKDADLKWNGNEPFKGLKHCVPFLDGMLTGYVATLWVDVFVDIEDGMQVFRHRHTEHEPISERLISSTENLPVPAGFHFRRFTWRSPFFVRTPKGYSLLLTHPINRDDLPFRTLSAVIDSDSIMTTGNVPFFIKQDFTGIIKKGTPLFQIIPFKRDDWESVENKEIIKIGGLNQRRAHSVISGWYKRNQWKVKTYQ
jgi:hypothetical protein